MTGKPDFPSAADDEAFSRAGFVLWADVDWRKSGGTLRKPTRKGVKWAAETMADFALRTNDSDAWAHLEQSIREYLNANRSVPAALVRALLERKPAERSRGRPGRGASLGERQIMRMQAAVVAAFREQGHNLEEALELAAEWTTLPIPKSAETIDKMRKWVQEHDGASAPPKTPNFGP